MSFLAGLDMDVDDVTDHAEVDASGGGHRFASRLNGSDKARGGHELQAGGAYVESPRAFVDGVHVSIVAKGYP